MLKTLSANNNKLGNLDVSLNTKLTELNIPYNQLANLDVSSNTLLTKLYANNNLLTNLDVSKNSSLTHLSVLSNQLQSLNLKNGNNTNFSLSHIYFFNNPNLTCIQVDNKAYSNTNWSNLKDATANYEENCGSGCKLFYRKH